MPQIETSPEYTVQGMSCGHCAMSAREEESEVGGVSAVDVDLASRRPTVTGGQIDDAAVRSAVGQAGYEVA